MLRLSPAALRTLAALPWPGNIRELRNVIERTAVFASGEEIQAGELILDEHVRPLAGEKLVVADPEPQELTLAELEQRHIRHVLREEGGHVERAAKRLGIPRSSLYAWIRSGRVERVTGEGEDPLAGAKPRLVR